MKFLLRDCQKMADLYPDDFWLPGRDAIDAVGPDDFVKLIFEDPRGICPPERMWVKILMRSEDFLKGQLDNHPFCLKSIKAGDVISFELRHICQIKEKNERS